MYESQEQSTKAADISASTLVHWWWGGCLKPLSLVTLNCTAMLWTHVLQKVLKPGPLQGVCRLDSSLCLAGSAPFISVCSCFYFLPLVLVPAFQFIERDA